MLNSTLNLMSTIDLRNIHSLTDFKRNANAYVEQLQATQLPLVLTVNGKAAVVVQEAGALTVANRSRRSDGNRTTII